MTEEKILTKHPLGKSGKNIDKQKYETLKKAILSALKKKELTHRAVHPAQQEFERQVFRKHQLVCGDS